MSGNPTRTVYPRHHGAVEVWREYWAVCHDCNPDGVWPNAEIPLSAVPYLSREEALDELRKHRREAHP